LNENYLSFYVGINMLPSNDRRNLKKNMHSERCMAMMYNIICTVYSVQLIYDERNTGKVKGL